MNNQTYYYPFIKSSSRVCALKKEQAVNRIDQEGKGELIEVPTFENIEETEEWIKQQTDSKNWDIGSLEKTPFNPEVVYCVIRDRIR